MDLTLEEVDKKGIWERAKDTVIERLKGAEQVALEAIEKAQSDVITDITAANESMKVSAQQTSELSQKAKESLTRAEESAARITSLSEESNKLVELTRNKSEEAKNQQTQIQTALKNFETSEAETKAHLKEIITTKAEMKNQFTEIGQFYSEIGEKKKELLDLKKSTAAELAEITESFSSSLNGHKERTEKLVIQNESIETEIKSHLQRAVGASLFSAFGTRKDKIVVGKWLWFGALALSMVAGFIWIHFMIQEMKGSLDIAFVVRTVFGALIGYFIYFCSKQYDRERKAEEEYAFKAAVSISLKPFHDLLIESKNKEIDSEFMKQLMKEIFDNPVNRLFIEGKSTSKLQINGQGLNGEHSVEPSSLKK